MAGRKEKGRGSANVLLVIRGILVLLLNLIFYAIIILGTIEGCKITYSFANEVFGEVMAEPPPGHNRTFVVAEADDAMTVSKNLEREGIIANAYSFYIRLRFFQSDKHVLLAGSYELNTSMTYEEILKKIMRGVNE